MYRKAVHGALVARIAPLKSTLPAGVGRSATAPNRIAALAAFFTAVRACSQSLNEQQAEGDVSLPLRGGSECDDQLLCTRKR
jgi:hypothetical protein